MDNLVGNPALNTLFGQRLVVQVDKYKCNVNKSVSSIGENFDTYLLAIFTQRVLYLGHVSNNSNSSLNFRLEINFGVVIKFSK